MKASALDMPEAKPARVTVKTMAGRVLTEDVMGHSGHPDRPFSARRDVINTKLDICANALRIAPDQREQIRETWWDLSNLNDISVAMATVSKFESLC